MSHEPVKATDTELYVLIARRADRWEAEYAHRDREAVELESLALAECASPTENKIIETDGTQTALARTLAHRNHEPYRMRIACVDCDTDEADGVATIPDGWDDVITADTPIGEIAVWWTHLGTCPACKEDSVLTNTPNSGEEN